MALLEKERFGGTMNMQRIDRRGARLLTSSGNSVELDSFSPAESWRMQVSRIWQTIGAFEWIALGYLTLSSLMILAYSRNLPHPGPLVGAQAFVAAFIFLLCGVAAGATPHRKKISAAT